MKKIMRKLSRKLPDRPGVYFFFGSPKRNQGAKKSKTILYIGKATSLRDRVKSYFGPDLQEMRGPKLVKMLEESTGVDFKVTDSVLEALILESALIKKYQPRYNTDEKDDKSFNYVVITDEDFPRVLVMREKDLLNEKLKSKNEKLQFKIKNKFGPFPHGAELQEALKIIRKIFPYRDTCTLCEALAKEGQACRPCFNRQIGLCPGVCTGEISKKEYAKVIRSIRLFFRGRKQEILRGLRKHMKREAKLRNFEKAAELRNKIFALEHINDVALLKRKRLEAVKAGFRIEAYDVAHISGTNTVGAMVVMEDGVPAKHEYRRFKIRGHKNDDPGSLKELLERRAKHVGWRAPDLAVVDGGNVQLTIGRKYFKNVVSVLKNEHHKPLKIFGESAVIRDYHHDILIANAEAHRFAITYHRLLRGKILK